MKQLSLPDIQSRVKSKKIKSKVSPGNYSSVHMCKATIKDKSELEMLDATQLDGFLLSTVQNENPNQKLIAVSF